MVDMRLELIAVPVSDVDRAKEFYVRAGFTADHDRRVSDTIRFVQLTPPGSACSISIGRGLSTAAPGSVQGLQVVVTDIDEARADLVARGIEVSVVQRFPWGRSSPSAIPTATPGRSRTRPEGLDPGWQPGRRVGQRTRRARNTRSSLWCAPAPPSGAGLGRCSSNSTTQLSSSSAVIIDGQT